MFPCIGRVCECRRVKLRRPFLDGLEALHKALKLQVFADLAVLADLAAFAAYLAPLLKAEWVDYA